MRLWERYKAARWDGSDAARERFSKLSTVLSVEPERRSTLTNDSWWQANFGSLFNTTTSNVNVNKENTFGIAAYRRGVELRAKAMAAMPCRLYRTTSQGKERIYTHELMRLMQEPNVFQTWFQWELWMNAMKVGRGNGYSYIVRGKNYRPEQLVPIPNPDIVNPIVQNGELYYQNQNAGLPSIIPATDMIHYKGMLWDNPLKGISPIAYHRERLGIIIAAEKTAGVTYKSGAKKFAVSTDRDINPDKQRFLKDTLEMVMNDEAVSVVLPAGGKIEELSLSPVDADYINNANLGVQEVNRMLGIPNSLNNLDGATKGSAEQEWQSFYSMTLLHDATDNEQELSRKLLKESEKGTYYFKYSFNSLMRANSAERIEYMGKAIRAGIMTPQTAQDLEDLPRTEGADETYLDANLIPTAKYTQWIDSKITANTTKTNPNPEGNN